MSEPIDLTEAIEAAGFALQDWDEGEIAVHAAASLIERAVRERIAADIQAVSLTHDDSLWMRKKAVRIARGDQ